MIKVSIVTPVNNSSATIERNIRSVIDQTYSEIEHIIVDNSSSDNSLEIIRRLYSEVGKESMLKIISENDRGISDAFNKGIRNSVGEIIGILNSDDFYCFNEVVKTITDAFNSDTQLLFVHGNIFFEDEQFGSNIRKPLLCKINEAMPYNHPTMFFRKSLYDKYGLFDEGYRYAMDYELVYRFEKSVENFREKGKYIDGNPLVQMAAGGASWKYEIESVRELKKIINKYGDWNFSAKKSVFARFIRIYLKSFFTSIGLRKIVRFSRDRKWN